MTAAHGRRAALVLAVAQLLVELEKALQHGRLHLGEQLLLAQALLVLERRLEVLGREHAVEQVLGAVAVEHGRTRRPGRCRVCRSMGT